MKTLSISITTKHAPVLWSEYPVERTARRGAFGVLAVLLFTYLYLVTASVFHVIERTETLTEIERLSGVVAGLEQGFFAKMEALTRERGGAAGLVPVGTAAYVEEQNAVVGVRGEPLY